MKKIKHKYVESYSAEELPNGVIVLHFSLNQKGCFYHRYNDTAYLICSTEKEYDEFGWGSEYMIETEDFLDRKNKKDTIYVCSSMLEGNTLSFFFIPYLKSNIKNTKKLL